MTLDEIAVQIADQQKRQFDLPFIEMVKDRVIGWRSKLIRQRLQDSPSDVIYFLTNLKLKTNLVKEKISIFLESEPIGKLVRTPLSVSYVGSYDFRNPFSKIEGLSFPMEDKYISKEPFYELISINAESYKFRLYNTKTPVVGVRIILEKPHLYNEDQEFDCPDDIVTDIINSITTIDLRKEAMQMNNELKL